MPEDRKLNCWEFMKCGREPGGFKAIKEGVCPAAVFEEADGFNSGKNGGRICWAIAGTVCFGRPQGSYAEKIQTCRQCDFYNLVKQEEGLDFHVLLPAEIMERMKS